MLCHPHRDTLCAYMWLSRETRLRSDSAQEVPRLFAAQPILESVTRLQRGYITPCVLT